MCDEWDMKTMGVAAAAEGILSVHESCPVCTPDVVLVHTPKPDAPLSK